MEKKLYVGNLSYTADDNGLTQLFSEVGTVLSAKVIMDRESGRSKGFAFVEMETSEQAGAAIERLNGVEFDGRSIRVTEARPKEEGSGGGFRGGNGGGGGARRGNGGGRSY